MTDLGKWEWGPDGKKLTCTWDVAWRGKCDEPVVQDDPARCGQHASSMYQECIVCGEQAVKECGETMGLVCGAPLCKDHYKRDCTRH